MPPTKIAAHAKFSICSETHLDNYIMTSSELLYNNIIRDSVGR